MINNYFSSKYFLLVTVFITISCAKPPSKVSSAKGGPERQRGEASPQNPSGGQNLVCTPKSGKKYVGFGGLELTAGRVQEVIGEGDRARVKPFSALTGEFQRVFNTSPSSLTKNGDTFDEPPVRWYVEPSISGVSLFTIYRAGYEAALSYVEANPDNLEGFSMPPNESTAGAVCQFLATRAWNRVPNQAELNACTKIALEETSSEPSVKNRWAYTIAAVISASDFLSY